MTSSSAPITIQRATDADARVLDRLARLDSQRLPAGPHLIALLDDHPVAAISLSSGRLVANPFAATEAVVGLLRERAGQVAGERSRDVPGRRPDALSLLRGLFPPPPPLRSS